MEVSHQAWLCVRVCVRVYVCVPVLCVSESCQSEPI